MEAELSEREILTLLFGELDSYPPEFVSDVEGNIFNLDLSSQKLTEVPPEILQMKHLEELSLAYNRLRQLPPELGQLPYLSYLDVSNNPELHSPPPEIVARGTTAILSFLRELQQERELALESVFRYESKLLVVGEGASGKSSLLRSLRGEMFDDKLNTTHGIEVNSYKLTHPHYHEIEITLNTWDFGGQDIYHATHQFFLTLRSLYLVVWNARQGVAASRLDYWLDTIQKLAPDSPVLLVATHTDERAPDLNYQLYKDTYPQLVGNVQISNKTGAGITEFKTILAIEAARLPLMGQPWPQKWIDAEQALLARREHHINAEQYMRIATKRGVDEEMASGTFGNYLHDLGKILYFLDDDVLSNLVVLKPNWVTKAISRVLTNEEVIAGKGILHHSELPRIWDRDDDGRRYKRHLYPVFLRLMERFDLSYQIEADTPGDHSTCSLVPQLLPHEPPPNLPLWPQSLSPNQPQVEMVYRLDFVPAGIMSWFIVRTHHYTTGLHWREGVILLYEGHQARVELNPMLRELRLLVWGALPQNFFTILMKTVDEIFKRFKGLQIERRIPCICHRQYSRVERCPRFFLYEDLVLRIEKGKLEIECRSSLQNVSVPEMLYGIHTSTDQEVIRDIQRGQQQIYAEIEDQRLLLEQINQQSELIGRNFMRLWNLEMKKIEVECPNTFFLMPGDNRLLDPAKWFNKEYRLYLVCQHPSSPHPVGNGYRLQESEEWWKAISPWLNHLVTFIKFAVPMGGKVFEAVATQATVDDMKASIGVLEELTKNLKEIDASGGMNRATTQPPLGKDQQATGAALRALHSFLTRVDKSRIWGGLHYTVTPDGNILWLCPEHHKPYQARELVLDRHTNTST